MYCLVDKVVDQGFYAFNHAGTHVAMKLPHESTSTIERLVYSVTERPHQCKSSLARTAARPQKGVVIPHVMSLVPLHVMREASVASQSVGYCPKSQPKAGG